MRVVDLLEMLHDVDNQAYCLFEYQAQLIPLTGSIKTVVDEQPRLILLTNDQAQNGMHRWELFLLLNQQPIYQNYIYVRFQDTDIPLFGFRIVPGRILLG